MELTHEILQSKWKELSRESMAPANSNSATTTLKITYVTADVIGVAYDTMPGGNQPNNYGNYVALWQNNNFIPWGSPVLKKQVIDTNTPQGDMNFTGLDITNNSYIIGYAVGPDLSGDKKQKEGNICATAFIPAKGDAQSSDNFMPNIFMQYIGTNSISVGFSLPSGLLPMTNGAWIGIWRAEQASYNNPPMAANYIQEDAGEGTAFINNITIGRGLTYTVGLFMSGWGGGAPSSDQKPMACSVTFTNR